MLMQARTHTHALHMCTTRKPCVLALSASGILQYIKGLFDMRDTLGIDTTEQRTATNAQKRNGVHTVTRSKANTFDRQQTMSSPRMILSDQKNVQTTTVPGTRGFVSMGTGTDVSTPHVFSETREDTEHVPV